MPRAMRVKNYIGLTLSGRRSVSHRNHGFNMIETSVKEELTG